MRRTEQQLNADIKAGKLARVYMLYGEEDFLIRLRTDNLVSLAVPEDAREMNFRKYSLVPGADKGTRDDRPPKIDELSDFAESLPFFAEKKCVLLKNFDAEALDKDELEGYIALINDLPDTGVVIFTRENMGEDPKKFKEKLEKGKMKKLIEAIDKNGIVCELNCFSRETLAGMAIKKCRGAGCEMSEENAVFLAESVGCSLSLLQTEIEKLCAYKGSGEITLNDIEQLVPKRIEGDIFAIVKELFAGQVGGAMKIVNALFAQQAKPEQIMSVLSGHFMDLYRAKLGIKAKKSQSETASVFGYFGNRKYAVSKAYSAVRSLSEAYLGDCIAVLYNANKQLHSSKAEGRLIIERAMIEISALPR